MEDLMTRHIVTLLALGTSLTASAGGEKVDICHWDEDTQSYEVLNISVNAVNAHFKNHDDADVGTWYVDGDGDGYGDAEEATDECPQPGLVDNGDDCDDTDADVNPGEEETPYNGIDDDCNADTPDDDLDNDGYGIDEDCDDDEATTYPGAEDVCGDGVDNDCDGTADEECDTCPCFTAEEMGSQLERVDDWSYDGSRCIDYTNSSINHSYTYLILNGYDYDGSSRERVLKRYMGRGYDTDYGSNYCETYNVYDYTYEYGVGYTRYVPRNIDRQYITADERNACEDIINEVAAAAEMTCATYNY